MAGNRDYIFVLWGRGFDEVAATFFVAEMRRRCLLVKVVGVGGSNWRGARGLAIVPDLLLDEALGLAAQANCVIVPCHDGYWRQLANDPRIPEFLAGAARNNAWLVREAGAVALEPSFAAPRILQYRCGDDSGLFTEQLVGIVEQVVG